MTSSATGEPVVTQEGTEARIGIDLRPGSLILTQTGEDFAAHHAWVYFSSVSAGPWFASEVGFSAKGPDDGAVGLTVDLLSKDFDGPRTRNTSGAPNSLVPLCSTPLHARMAPPRTR
ncbi:hypothetical protein SLA_7441 [Streptomyces laurentii]|uniref:Uncharacterized protein n=1 Tax=Streptomyces laurentii TaxID=39478 RepID=A0A169PQT0_STRLU|nr:hypothetical protein SLA_7441 [Streptomyces laurentii]